MVVIHWASGATWVLLTLGYGTQHPMYSNDGQRSATVELAAALRPQPEQLKLKLFSVDRPGREAANSFVLP